jgi:anti-sigma B factor antagonist
MSSLFASTIHTSRPDASASPLRSLRRGAVTIVQFPDARLDAHVAIGVKRQLISLVADGHTRLVLDLSTVGFMDSSGLGALVAVLKQVGGGGELVLAGVEPAVYDLLALTRMDRVFPLYPHADAAVLALGGTSSIGGAAAPALA